MNKRRGKIRAAIRAARKWTLRITFVAVAGSMATVIMTRHIPIHITPLMLIRISEQIRDRKPLKMNHRWVSIDKIAQPMALAVIASEDNRFMTHHGFDFEQIGKARADAERGRRLRGASTISQQTAKNAFLWPGKSYLRKGLEAYFTILIELFWGKKRIMEVYLNSIEMGDGVYGAQAAAEAFFKKDAIALTRSEAALIAATLPNPLRFSAQKPSAYLLRRQTAIMSLMNKVGTINLGASTSN